MRTIAQSYSLYNVAGLIDKNKNIYFVPHQADIYLKRIPVRQTRVNSCYEALFNEICPPSSKYSAVPISNWSPEDRTLRVDGTIDDFRVSRGQGLALNYCIVTRVVADSEGGNTTRHSYFYAFFIDSVRQAGANSVELVLSVDHFTNFFYLNNEELISLDYDPFNPVMSNCLVQRQHYDRLRLRQDNSLEVINEKIMLGTNESFKYRYQYKNSRYLMPIGLDIPYGRFSYIYDRLRKVNNENEFRNLIGTLSYAERRLVASLFISYLNIDFKENILPPITYGVLADSEETEHFNNGRGFKGGLTKVSNGVSSPIIHFVYPYPSVPYDLSNIEENWVAIHFRVELEGYNVTLATQEYPSQIMAYLQEIGATQYILSAYISKYSPLFNYATISFSSSSSQSPLTTTFRAYISEGNPKHLDNLDFTKNDVSTLERFENPLLAILPIYQTKKINDNEYKKVVVTEPLYTVIPNGHLPEVMFAKDENTGDYNEVSFDYVIRDGDDIQHRKRILENITFSDLIYKIGFILPSTLIEDFDLKLPNISGQIDDERMLDEGYYFEPILESDPYKFYSISYQETEQILHKLRYFENYTVSIKAVVSYNEAYKIGLIPSYNLNGKFERYYGESIVTVVSSQIPMIEDSWLSYYTQNKAQMKNQYAVNNTSHLSDLVSGALNLPIQAIGGSVGVGLGEKGKFAGGGSAIKSSGGIIGTAVDWVSSNKIITETQSAKLSDMGAKPDTIKLSGSDLLYDLSANDLGFHINYYVIDDISYNSNAKYLERYGYEVSIQDKLNPFNRIGLNFIKLDSFDFVEDNIKITQEQADAITTIFYEGVTLLHDKNYLHNLGNDYYHNIEISLGEEPLPIVFRDITRTDIDNNLEVVFNPDMEHITTLQPAKLQFSGDTGGYTVRKRSRETLEVIETLEGINQINLLANDSINAYTKSGGSSTNVLNVTFANYLSSDYYITIQLNEGQSPSTSDLNPSELIKNLYAYIEGGDN